MIIGIITDFGSKGMHYVAEMKGVGLKINPDLQFIDISHDITPFQVIEANYVLQTVYHTLPPGTFIVCVVDPGVGTNRKIIAFHTTDDYYFVGPDNGIFSYFIEQNLIEAVVEVSNSQYFNHSFRQGKKSGDRFTITFHGRDIMMPVAAFFSKGITLDKFGNAITQLSNLKSFNTGLSVFLRNEPHIHMMIQYIDSFGNLITNVKISDFLTLVNEEEYQLNLVINSEVIPLLFRNTFANNDPADMLFIPGSSGYMEICQNQNHAANSLKLTVGTHCTVQLSRRGI